MINTNLRGYIAGCALLTAGMAAPVASADVLMSNFSAAQGTGTVFGNNTTSAYKAFGFTMGTTDYFLDEAVLMMSIIDQGANPIVSIWSGETEPETELIVLDNPPNMFGLAQYSFTPAAAFIFEANMSYWVHVSIETPGAGPRFTWEGTNPQTMPTGIGTAIGYIFDGMSSGTFNRLEILGTVVPAPGAIALLGLAGLIGSRRRRSSRC